MTVDQLDALYHGGLALVGLLALDRALAFDRRADARRARLAFAVVLLVGLVAYPGWDRIRGENLLHGSEQVHYVLGAKYFAELGYAGLYDALAYASFESGSGLPTEVRNLSTGVLEPGTSAMPRGEALSAEFPGTRYLDFKNDLRALVAASPNAHLGAVQDHGFNATPPWIAVARAVLGDRPLDEPTLLALAGLDVVLLFSAALAMLVTFGLRRTAVAMLCFGTAYTFRSAWNGGSFLRFDWLAALAFAACALRKEKFLLAGSLLAYATAMRLFPAFFALAAAAPLVMALRTPLARRRLFALCLGFGVAAGGLFVLGGSSPRGFGAYREFRARIASHGSAWASNHVGFDTVGIADEILFAELRASRAPVDFEMYRRPIEAARTARRPLFVLALFAALAATFAAGRRLRADQAMPLGAVLVFAASTISGYYWAMTLVVPLVAPLRTSVGLVGISLLACMIDGIAGALTLGHLVVSFGYLFVFVDWLVRLVSGSEGTNPLDDPLAPVTASA